MLPPYRPRLGEDLTLSDFRPASRSQCGAILLEAVFLVAVLIFVMSGVWDYGVLIRESNMLLEAARHGARSAGGAGAFYETQKAALGWCTAGTAVASDSSSCAEADILAALGGGSGGNEGLLGRAMRGACSYLKLTGMKESDWKVRAAVAVEQIDYRVASADESRAVPRITTTVSQVSTSASRCMLCLVQAFAGRRISGASTFPVMVSCN